MTIERTKITALTNLIERIKQKEFDIETQYKFLVIFKKIEEEKQIIDEQLLLLAQLYGEKDINGELIFENGAIKLQPSKVSICQKKTTEILSLPITFPDIYFTLDELKPLQLSFEELYLLEPFIKIA